VIKKVVQKVGSTQAVSKLLLRRNMLSLRKPEPDSAQHSERVVPSSTAIGDVVDLLYATIAGCLESNALAISCRSS
jgi:hypothetical protein